MYFEALQWSISATLETFARTNHWHLQVATGTVDILVLLHATSKFEEHTCTLVCKTTWYFWNGGEQTRASRCLLTRGAFNNRTVKLGEWP